MLTTKEIQNIIDENVSSDWAGALADIGVIRGKEVEPLLHRVITATLHAVGAKAMCERHAPHARTIRDSFVAKVFEKAKARGVPSRTQHYVLECPVCTYQLGEDEGFANGKGRGEQDGKALGREEMLSDITNALTRALRRLTEAE